MDRALNAEHIRLALGEHGSLPSSTELIELIGRTEVALFSGSASLDPKLRDVAWYLHSVASALPALEIYGLERQRAAFQVSAHLMDLLLTDSALPYDERRRLVFAAEVAYLRGDLNPNAIAAYRSRGTPSLLTEFDDPTAALQIGAALVAFDTSWLFRALPLARRSRDVARERWGVEPTETVFGAAAHAMDGAWNMLRYLVYGVPEALVTSRTDLLAAIAAPYSREDLDTRWVAFHLLQISDLLENTSLWSILPPDTSPTISPAFTMAAPPILSFWPPQVELLRRDRDPLPLDSSVRRMVWSIPTSAGKTLLSQVVIADHIVREGTGVCFVAPTRSLCREVQASLRRRLRLMAAATEISISDLTFEVPFIDESSVDVMTPERLAFLMREDLEQVLTRYGLFVFDEAHAISDGSRGWTLEWVLATLHHHTRETRHRILAMSAALGQRANIVNWLDPDGTGVDYHSDWRGPRRVHAIYTAEPDWDHPRELERPSAASPERREYDQFGTLRIRPTRTGRIHQLATTSPVGKLVLRPPTLAKDRQLSTAFRTMLAPLAIILGRSGPVLVISSTKPEAMRLAREIADLQPNQAASPLWLSDLASSRLGDAHPLTRCLLQGVGYHHASLPSDILLGIEEAMAADELQFVVATTTLTEGVNLPVRTVIIASQGAFGADDGYQDYIVGARLLNAIGRAGRAARESEGWVVLARNARFSAGDFERLRPTEADMPVQSVLAGDEALDQLAALELIQAQQADAALARPGALLEGFVSYVWYVASIVESQGGAVTDDTVAEYLSSTLAWQQLAVPVRERFGAVARSARASYSSRPSTVRRRWSRAGTSIAAAAVLDQIAMELAEIPDPDEETPVDVLAALAEGDRLGRMLALPEAQLPTMRRSRGGRIVAVAVDSNTVLREWISGVEVADLADHHLGGVRDPEFRLEQIADYLTSAFENFLPWAVGLVLSWANSARTGMTFELEMSLPAFIRYGVDTLEAVRLVRGGLPSRSLAASVARDYLVERPGPETTIRQWLCSLDLGAWRDRYTPSPAELRALLEFARAPGTRFAATLLHGEPIEVPVRSLADAPNDSIVELLEVPGDPAPARLGFWLEGELVATLLPDHFAEIDAVLSTGIPMIVTLLIGEAGARARLQLRNWDV